MTWPGYNEKTVAPAVDDTFLLMDVDDVTDSPLGTVKFIRYDTLADAVAGAATLQSAYNASADGEILTNAVLGALKVQRGSAADTDEVLQVLNGAGGVALSVTGAGVLKANTITPTSGTTVTVTSTLLGQGTIRAGGVSVPSSGTGVELSHDGTTGSVTSYDRTGAAWKNLQIRGAVTTVQSSGGTMLTIDGADVTVTAGKALKTNTIAPASGSAVAVNGTLQLGTARSMWLDNAATVFSSEPSVQGFTSLGSGAYTFVLAAAASGTTVFGTGLTSDTHRRFRITANGDHYWGNGAGASALVVSGDSNGLTVVSGKTLKTNTINSAGSGYVDMATVVRLNALDANEGGELILRSGTSFSGDATIDMYQNALRIFWPSGTADKSLDIFNAGSGAFNMLVRGTLEVTAGNTLKTNTIAPASGSAVAVNGTLQVTSGNALKLGNAAVSQTPSATHTLEITDSAGTVYEVLCRAKP